MARIPLYVTGQQSVPLITSELIKGFALNNITVQAIDFDDNTDKLIFTIDDTSYPLSINYDAAEFIYGLTGITHTNGSDSVLIVQALVELVGGGGMQVPPSATPQQEIATAAGSYGAPGSYGAAGSYGAPASGSYGRRQTAETADDSRSRSTLYASVPRAHHYDSRTRHSRSISAATATATAADCQLELSSPVQSDERVPLTAPAASSPYEQLLRTSGANNIHVGYQAHAPEVATSLSLTFLTQRAFLDFYTAHKVYAQSDVEIKLTAASFQIVLHGDSMKVLASPLLASILRATLQQARAAATQTAGDHSQDGKRSCCVML